MELAATSASNNTTKEKNNYKKYSSKGTSTNPVGVIGATYASSVMVKDLGQVQVLGLTYWMGAFY